MSSKKVAPREEDWERYLSFLQEQLKLGSPTQKVNTLVLELGGGPTAGQRKKLVDLTKPYLARVAVITASATGRGVVTALSWFNNGYKAFNLNEQEEAFAWLEIPHGLLPEVRRTLVTLEREVLQ